MAPTTTASAPKRGCHSARDAADDDRDGVCSQHVLQTPHRQKLTDDVQHPQQDHRPHDNLDDEHRVAVGEATDQDAPGDRCNGGDDEGSNARERPQRFDANLISRRRSSGSRSDIFMAKCWSAADPYRSMTRSTACWLN